MYRITTYENATYLLFRHRWVVERYNPQTGRYEPVTLHSSYAHFNGSGGAISKHRAILKARKCIRKHRAQERKCEERDRKAFDTMSEVIEK